MKNITAVLVALSLCAVLNSISPQFGSYVDLGLIEFESLSEASGLVSSRKNAQVFWSHNDSGDESNLYAFNNTGDHLGVYLLDGISARDWEDIATGPGPLSGEHYLYIGDIGDNAGQYQDKYVHRVIEPEVSSGQQPGNFLLTEIETITLRYPGTQMHDAETLMIDPLSGDLYIVTKRNGADHDLVYRAAYPQSTTAPIVMEEIATLTYPAANGFGATAGDISPSGLEILIKTYSSVYYWSRSSNSSVSEAFNAAPLSVTYFQEPQGEALAWKNDGMGYYTVSEEPQIWLPAHLYFYPRLDNYISIINLPTALYLPDENFTIDWEPSDLFCELLVSSSPGGEVPENYFFSGISGTGGITSSPAAADLGTGVHYCTLYNEEFNYISYEFQIIAESDQGVVMNEPMNGSMIYEQTPVFSWEENPGVPYYFIVLSDHPFTIEEDENGDPTVTGLQPVWQIITPSNTALYGCPDPSGYFNNVFQPLISGVEYNWIVANNYGNDPLLTSKVVAAPFAFQFEAPYTIPSPQLIYPENNSEVIDGTISFVWSEVEQAMNYHIYLYEVREENGSIGNYLIWDQITTNTYCDLNAQAILINSEYLWKVIATDDNDISSVSEDFAFMYLIASGTLSLSVRDIYDSPIGFATADLDPVDGSHDNVPFAVNALGNEIKTIPPGEYILTCSKAGYETRDTLITIWEDPFPDSSQGDTEVTVVLPFSPSIFYGNVVDIEGYLIENVNITALKENGELRSTVSNTGSYFLGVSPGHWLISADVSGYTLINPIDSNIIAGENQQLADLIMSANLKNAEGYVKNLFGSPLSGAIVTAVKGQVERTISTNSGGFYQFTGLNFGSWSIYAEKQGYISSEPVILTIDEYSPMVNSVADIILIPPSNIVIGSAGNSIVGMEGVLISAIPVSGNPYSTLTNNYGNYTLNLPGNSYEIRAYLAGFTSQNIYQISLNVGETIDNINFILLPTDCSISGNVTSSGSGLSGANVIAGTVNDITDGSGFYHLDLAAGAYTVSAEKTGYTCSNPQYVSVVTGQDLSGINLQMVPNASTVTGKVEHAGTSITNALVTGIRQSTGATITGDYTDSNGNYELNLIPGTYLLWAEKDGFICAQGDTLALNIAPGQNFNGQNIELTPYRAFISGTTYTFSGNPLRSVNILVQEVNNPSHSYFTVSGSMGNFSLIVKPDDPYIVTAAKSGYQSEQVQIEPLAVGEEIVLEFYLQPLPTIVSGKVYNQQGNPLVNATVSAVNDNVSYQTLTALNGFYSLNIAPGSYDITAAKLGYLPLTNEIQINPGENILNYNFYLQDNFGSLEGIVRNSVTQAPIAGAMITANQNNRSTVLSDQNGYYQMNQLLPGIYDITVSKQSYQTRYYENQVIPGNTTVVLNPELVPLTSSILAYADLSRERDFIGVTISAENMVNGEIVSGVTDNSQSCLLSGLMSNVPHTVSAVKVNYFAPDTVVVLSPDETMIINFSMVLINGAIGGRITDPDNNGLGNVIITAESVSGFSGTAVSNSAGYYGISNLNPDTEYTITAELAGYTQPEELIIFLNEELEEVNIMLYPNQRQISGVVKDQEGNVLPEIPVVAESAVSSGTDLTNSQGYFQIEELAPFQQYLVQSQIYQQGYENGSLYLEMDNENIDIGTLTVDVHLAKITGVITDLNTGDNLQGVNIIALNTLTGQTVTAISQPDGSYHLRYLYSGEYELTFMKNSYQTVYQTVQLAHLQTLTFDICMQYIVPVTISGVVIDSDDRLIGDIPVNLVNEYQQINTVTGQEGEFSFSQVLPYTVNQIGTNLPAVDFDNALIEVNVGVEDIDTLLVIDIHNAVLEGLITDIEANPLSNVEVILTGLTGAEVDITSAEGIYHFDGLYEGEYFLQVIRSGYQDTTATIELADYQVLVRDFILDYEMGSITGFVHNSQGDQIKNGVIRVWQDEIFAGADTTSAAGTFSIAGLIENFEYSVTGTKKGYQNYLHPELVNPDAGELQIVLETVPNSVLGNVVNNGAEVSGCMVRAKSLQGYIFQDISNNFGDYLISNLAGYYDVWANYNDSLVSYTESVYLESGQSEIVDLELVPASRIQGRVTYNGVGKPGVTVFAQNILTGRVYSQITDIGGNYDLTGMIAGTYEIDFLLEGFTVNEDLPLIELVEGETVVLPDYTLTFIANSIAGSVYELENRDAIANARIRLYQQEILLDSLLTGPNGTFLFTGLSDGAYVVTADHPGFIEPEPVAVELSEGESIPQTIDFLLEPIDLVFFGRVWDPAYQPLSGAAVTAFRESRDRIRREIYIDTTDVQGFYQLEVDTVGIYNLSAEKDGYYESESVQLELNYQDSNIEHNFILHPILQYGTLQGKLIIHDLLLQQYLPADEALLQLFGNSGEFWELSLNYPDTLFSFDELPVTTALNLEVSATYQGYDYFRNISDIIFTQQDTLEQNVTFIFSGSDVSLSGHIFMHDEIDIPLNGAEIVLLDSLFNEVDLAVTNNSGFYQFNNLAENNYSLDISAYYQGESFSTRISGINWTGNDLIVNHTFDFLLGQLQFLITEDGQNPVPGATIRISSEQLFLLLITNANGYAATQFELPTEEYTVKIDKNYGSKGRYIKPASYLVAIDSLTTYIQQKQLPLQFDEDQLEPLSIVDSREVILHKSAGYNDEIYYHYINVNGDYYSLEMDCIDDTTCVFLIPPQGNSGQIEFWFTSQSASQNLYYTNEDNPYMIPITAAGILDAGSSEITPDQPILVYNQEIEFEVNLADNSGNSLNQQIDENGIVQWSLTDSTIGTIYPVSGEKRKISFLASDYINGDIQGQIRAFISLDDVSIILRENIQIKDMKLDRLVISGPEEVDNLLPAAYNITALSDSNIVMSIPFGWTILPSLQGELSAQNNSIVYSPGQFYIGRMKIEVTAVDPNYGNEVRAEKYITVYKRVNLQTEAVKLLTGEGSNLFIHADMLDSLQIQQAKIYYRTRQVSPYVSTGEDSEIISAIFRLRSNRLQQSFLQLPGIELENPEAYRKKEVNPAYWDNGLLSWQIIEDGVQSEDGYIKIDHVPLLERNYGLLTESDKLGIHDLKLRPNPFTPFDQIGMNQGLQIEFRLSSVKTRYPLITAEIYTMEGTLVRTIAKDKPLLKGNYQAGEQETLYWDGRTDAGKLARNGRYVLRLVAEDVNDRDEIVRTVVLIK